jgi:hypothetical protein
LVHGACPTCTGIRRRLADAQRDSTDARGYTRRWKHFRAAFFRMLIARHVIPMCGARLSGVPSASSLCSKQSRMTFDDLHLDHDPPLEAWERSRPERVCDPQRVGFLCASCHSAKTRHEMRSEATSV